MKYSIVIPTYNHCDDLLKPCIESILKYSNLDDIEIVVSANGCVDNTRDYLVKLRQTLNNHLVIVWNAEAIGFPKATNAGIRASSGDYIVLLNNDCMVLESPKNEWLRILESAFVNPKVGISGVHTLTSEVIKRDFLVFYCVMMKRQLFDELGLLDEEFGIGAGEDIEFCLRAQDNGYTLASISDATHNPINDAYTGSFPLFHRGEGTMHDGVSVTGWDGVMRNNNDILRRKFLFERQKVKLNIGCGPIITYQDYINIDSYDKHADLICSAESLPMYKDNSVDEIITSHLVEHINPFHVAGMFDEWKRILKPGGSLVIEMPDIEKLCLQFVNGNKQQRYDALNGIYCPLNTAGDNNGDPTIITSPHLFGWYPEILEDALRTSGFTDITFTNPKWWHSNSDMRCEAKKPSHIKYFDQETYNEIFVQNGYHLYDYEMKGRTVIDIGANLGIFTEYALHLGAKEVHAFEPVPSIFKRLVGNIPSSDVYCYNNAVTDKDDEIVKITDDGTHSTIYADGNVEVETVSLDTILGGLDKKNVVLKLDCEGSEYEILLGASKETLDRVDIIVMEHHTTMNTKYMNCPELLWNKLESHGFRNVMKWGFTMWEVGNGGIKLNERFMGNYNEKWVRTPLVHIVTPTYGRPEKLRKCVESVQKQTYQNYIHHICSDGYDADIESYVKSLGNKHVYTFTPHEGACGGLPRKSIIDGLPDSGDYICFLDDDNLMLPHYLNEMVGGIDIDHELAVCMIYHDMLGAIIPQPQDVTENSVTFRKIDSLCFMTTVHRAKQHSHLWIHNKSQHVTHDYDFPQAILGDTKLKYIEKVLGTHGQITK